MPRIQRSIRQRCGRQQPRGVVAHASGSRERRKVRRPLHPAPTGGRTADRRQRKHREHQDQPGPKECRENLSALARPGCHSRRAATETKQTTRNSHGQLGDPATGPRPGKGAPRGELSRRAGRHPARHPAASQLLDRQRRQRSLVRERDEQAPTGDGEAVRLESGNPEPTREMNDRQLGPRFRNRRGNLLHRLGLLEGQMADMAPGGCSPAARSEGFLHRPSAGGGQQGRAAAPRSVAHLHQQGPRARQGGGLDSNRGRQALARPAVGPGGENRRDQPPPRGDRDHACDVTASASATTASGAGGRNLTVTLPSSALTWERPRAQAGSASMVARLASFPAIPASAPASAAPSATVIEYPTSSSWSAIAAARASAGRAASSSTEACPAPGRLRATIRIERRGRGYRWHRGAGDDRRDPDPHPYPVA